MTKYLDIWRNRSTRQNIFQRHLKKNGKAITVHTNNRTNIEQIDFDKMLSLVKIHSDFQNFATIVLTQNQYKKIESNKEYEYLREFLKSYVLTRRLLIVGYSLSDPDVTLVLSEATRIIRRQLPIYAILSNASKDQIKEWDLKYNIKIFSYTDNDGTHNDLKRILNLLVEYSGVKSQFKPKDTILELKEAQHLYIWHKLSANNDLESLHGAIDSLLLGLLFEHQDDFLDVDKLKEKVIPFIPSTETREKVIPSSIDRLEGKGFLKEKNRIITILPPGKGSCEKNIGQFKRLCNLFKEQLILDCKEDLCETSHECESIADIALNAIINLFKERAIEIFSSIFKENPSGVNPSLGMLKIFNENAAGLNRVDQKAWVIMQCSRILKSPRHHENELISYLSRAYYCYQALQLDPDAYIAKSKYLAERLCIIDSNVLIPCICDGHPNQYIYKDAFKKASEMGIKFYVLDETIKEVLRAANWARDLIRDYGNKSAEVLLAATGYGSYRPNQFLEAYIETTGKKELTFDSYISSLFKGSLTQENVKNIVAEKLFFYPCSEDDITCFSTESEFYNNVKREINDRAEDSIYSKTFQRAETEAKVYTIIAKWNRIKKEQIAQNRCCFISTGGFLNTLSKSEKVGISFAPAMTMDGIIEILRFCENPTNRMDFQKWIKLNYFPGSVDLLSSKAARQFFEKTINEAEEAYYENLSQFQHLIDRKLSKNYLDTVEYVERPAFVASLFAKKSEIDIRLTNSEKFYKEKYEESEKDKLKLINKTRYWRSQARLKNKKNK